MDVALPGMDGFDVTRVIKSRPELAAVPILLMTDRPDRSQLAFGIQSGATDLLSKPVAHGDLTARVWEILQHKGFDPPFDRARTKTVPRDPLLYPKGAAKKG
jgi:DNA-binding response OmpR family regulator